MLYSGIPTFVPIDFDGHTTVQGSSRGQDGSTYQILIHLTATSGPLRVSTSRIDTQHDLGQARRGALIKYVLQQRRLGGFDINEGWYQEVAALDQATEKTVITIDGNHQVASVLELEEAWLLSAEVDQVALVVTGDSPTPIPFEWTMKDTRDLLSRTSAAE